MRKIAMSILAGLVLSAATPANAVTEPQEVVWYHYGGEEIHNATLKRTIDFVVGMFNNLKHDGHMTDLVYETLIVETRAGTSRYEKSAKNWNNYGIAQIREDTAEYLKSVLRRKNKIVYYTIMGLYDDSLSEKENLLNNVPYSIAICLQYYQMRINEIKEDVKIGTLRERARVWKRFYNTSKGIGTEQQYLTRVQKFSTELENQ